MNAPWWWPLLAGLTVLGAAMLLAALAAVVFGVWRLYHPVVPDGAHTEDDWAPGMYGPPRKGQVPS